MSMIALSDKHRQPKRRISYATSRQTPIFTCVAKVPNGIQVAQVGGMHREAKEMKVFIVEDAEIVREALTTLLSEIPGVEVIGAADDEQGAIEQICAMSPDVVILDISLQPGSGIDVLKAVKKHNPAIKVVMLTNYTDEIYVNRCMSAGADCFFDKSHEFMRVGAALRQLALTGKLDNPFVALP